MHKKPLLLMILDGWGVAPASRTNAVTTAERALGRALTAAEYGRTWAKANADYTQGVNR